MTFFCRAFTTAVGQPECQRIWPITFESKEPSDTELTCSNVVSFTLCKPNYKCPNLTTALVLGSMLLQESGDEPSVFTRLTFFEMKFPVRIHDNGLQEGSSFGHTTATARN